MADGITNIALYGAFDIRVGDRPVNPGLTGPTRSLLQFLICNGDRLVRREHLMESFWARTSPERRRSSLNCAIWRIKKSLKAMGHVGRGLSIEACSDCVRLAGHRHRA